MPTCQQPATRIETGAAAWPVIQRQNEVSGGDGWPQLQRLGVWGGRLLGARRRGVVLEAEGADGGAGGCWRTAGSGERRGTKCGCDERQEWKRLTVGSPWEVALSFWATRYDDGTTSERGGIGGALKDRNKQADTI